MIEKFQTLEVRCRKSSNHWKFFAVLFPMLGSLAVAQGPGSQVGFFQAWWGQSAGFPPWDATPYPLQQAFNAIPRVFIQTAGTLSYTNGAAHGAGSFAFAGGVAIPDGRVVLVPLFSATIRTYDPALNTIQTNATHGRGTFAFRGGTLIPDGRVIFAASSAGFVGIYDPVAGTYTNGPAVTAGGDRFDGAVLTANGDKVIFVPRDNANVGIYDISANTYTTGAAKITGRFAGGALISDGRIVMAPVSAASVGIYDPVANTFTNSNTHGQGSSAFGGAVAIPDGRVVLVPFGSANIGLYDPASNTYTNGPAHGVTTPNVFLGGTLMPDGRVFLSTYGRGVAGIYDPSANTFSTITTESGADHFFGAVLTTTGKIILVPLGSANVGIFSGQFNPVPENAVLSRIYNKF
jgi:hypothetical protein